MKPMKRSIRRHHYARLKKKRISYWGKHAGSSKKHLGICISTPCICSCWMCSNRRMHEGTTLQELKSLASHSLDY